MGNPLIEASGTIAGRKPGYKERAANALQDLIERVGVDRYTARKWAQSVVGGESSNLPAGMGLLDATGVGSMLDYADNPDLAGAVMVPGILKAAPRDEALRTAQRNAAKPVSEGGLGLRPDNTQMERAKAMGFDTDVFHGQTGMSLLERGQISEVSNGTGRAEGGALFASGPRLASRYAKDRDWMGQGGAVYPLKVRSADLLKSGYPMPSEAEIGKMTPKEVERLINDIDNWNNKANKVTMFLSGIDEAKTAGKSGAVFRQVVDSPTWMDARREIPQDVYGLVSGVRSRFAAFDPARRSSADILAGLLAPSVGLGLLMDYEE